MGQKVRRAAKTALSRSPIDSESTGSPMKNGKSSLYEALKRRILTLELAPDQDLDEAELSEEYGFSPNSDARSAAPLAGEGYVGTRALCTARIANFVVDAEQCANGLPHGWGIRWDDFEEALAAVRDVGRGGHYLVHPHTPANFQRAFFMPKLFDNNSFEQWTADGSKDTTERALNEARAKRAAYEEPKLDEPVDEAPRDFVARRGREIPAIDALNNEH